MQKKSLKISFNSPVILRFSLICLAAFLLNFITGGAANRLFFSVYRTSFADPLSYVRMIGHVFGHVGLDHLMGNLMLLLVVGPLLEEKYGHASLVLVILTTALVTGLVNVMLFPQVRLLGASGVVFALILLSSFTCLKDGEIPLTFLLVAGLYLGQQVYDGLVLRDNVANLTHILGGVVGSGLGYLLNKNKRD